MQGAVTNKPVTKTLTWPEREFSLVREIIHAHKHRRKHTELRLVGGGGGCRDPAAKSEGCSLPTVRMALRLALSMRR